MAKKISEKIVSKHTFKAEGILNIDSLEDNVVLLEVEEIGELDFKALALSKFNGRNIKITIEETEEEVPDIEY